MNSNSNDKFTVSSKGTNRPGDRHRRTGMLTLVVVGWWMLTSNLYAQPGNDSWTGGIDLGLLDTQQIITTGTNINATTQAGEQHLDNSGASVWWTFLPLTNGPVRINTIGSNFDTQLHIYTALENGFANWELVAGNNDTNGLQSQVTFNANALQFYAVRVGGYVPNKIQDAAMGQIVLAIVQDNDHWHQKIDLGSLYTSDVFSADGYNVGATTQPDEQQVTNTGATVWWSFYAPLSGTVRINTLGSDFDTQLHVYRDFQNGYQGLIPVANNNNTTGSLQSQVQFEAIGGKFYAIRVGGNKLLPFLPPDTGQISLFVEPIPPANDDFLGSTQLNLPFEVSADNEFATVEPGEPNDGFGVYSTVWWNFTAPADGYVTMDTFGSDFDTMLHVYTSQVFGQCANNFSELLPVTSNDDAGGTNQSRIAFSVDKGQCMDLRVSGGLIGSQGNIELNGTFHAGPLLLGDVNLDGIVSLLDVEPFVTLLNSGGYQVQADINGDGDVTLLDIAGFVEILFGG